MDTQTKQDSALRVGIPIASVYVSTLIGPGIVMGVYASNYFANLGVMGIFVPLAFALFVTLFFYCGFSHVRSVNNHNTEKVYDYSSIARAMYGKKLSPFMMPVYETWLLLSMLLTGGSCLAAGGTLISSVLGVSTLMGSIIMAGINLVIAALGTEFLRRYATVLMALMTILCIGLVGLSLYFRGENLVNLFATGWKPEGAPSIGTGIWRVFMLACSTSIWSLGLGVVAQKMVNKKQTMAAALLSGLGGAMVFILSTIVVLSYCPEIMGDSAPIFTIVCAIMVKELPWIPVAYYLLMFLALADVATAQLVVSTRVKKLIPAAAKTQSRVFDVAIGFAYMVICISISLLGLDVIIGRFYQYLGYVGMVISIIPLVFVWPWLRSKGVYPKLWWKKEDEGAEEMEASPVES